jgi:hypothetical protein
MIKFLKNLWRDRRGNALVIAAAASPLLMAAAGFATDTIQWTLWKRELQRAADSAAIAGVYDRVANDSTDGVNDVVAYDLTQNQHTGLDLEDGYPQVTTPADDGDIRDQVRVVLAVRKSLPFSSMFMSVAPLIKTSATAATIPGAGVYCVIGLDPSVGAVGLDIGGSTTVDLGECSAIANSANPNEAAKNTGDGSTFIAKSLAAVGGVKYSKNWTVGSYDPYSTAATDPFGPKGKNLTPPAQSDCDENITVAKKDFPIDRTSVDNDVTKVVCINGDFTVQGVAKLGSAVYVINGSAGLTMNSTGSSLSCPACTIVMTNFDNPANTGSIKLTGGTVDIKAPVLNSGAPYEGIAFFQDRKATDSGQKTQNQVNGNSSGGVEGVIYIPNQSLLYNGGGNNTAICMMIVGKRLEFTGNSKIKLASDCGAAGIPNTGDGTRRVRLIA